MPAKVDRVIKSIQKTGKTEAQAIAIAKARGLIEQKGKHLVPGPKLKNK